MKGMQPTASVIPGSELAGLLWWQWCLVILSIGVVSIAVRVAFTLDLNAWMKRRDERRLDRLRNLCPHTEIGKEDGHYYVRSLATSPFGRTDAFCQRCGQHFIGGLAQAQEISAAFAKNPEALLERQKKFLKAAKKLP